MKTRIGLVLVPGKDLNEVVIRYLLLHLNTLQNTFQFEFFPYEEKFSVLATLAGQQAVNWKVLKGRVRGFEADYQAHLDQLNDDFQTGEAAPTHYAIVTMARFEDDYFSHRAGNVGVLALGNWERHMAPPSIHEFLITLVLRQAVAAVAPSLRGSVHYGTKGCLCDMGVDPSEVRFKVLNGFVCAYCRDKLASDGLPDLADELTPILSLQWLGKLNDPSSPAGIAASLGFKLFVTRGITPTRWERFLDLIQEEGIKQSMQLIGAVVLAAVILWLGFKT